MANADSPQIAATSVEQGVAHLFGLIAIADADRPELHGYEVTMSGRLVTPELHPRHDEGIGDPVSARSR